MTLVVLSPHLDDAIMSVGGLIHRLSAAGTGTRIVTLFAGDPTHRGPASEWDARRGLANAADVFAARRAEDASAAAIIGAQTVWLPFCDASYERDVADDIVWAHVAPHLTDATAVLVPGFPIVHSDHERTTLLALARLAGDTRLACYAEEPYCLRPRYFPDFVRRTTPVVLQRVLPGPVAWRDLELGPDARKVKARAVSAYTGEIEALGMRTRLDAVMARALRRERVGAFAGRSLPKQLRQEAHA